MLLACIPWSCAFFDDDIEYNWSCWKDLLFMAMDECIPVHWGKKKSNAPWISKDLIRLCRQKKLYNKVRKNGNPALYGVPSPPKIKVVTQHRTLHIDIGVCHVNIHIRVNQLRT